MKTKFIAALLLATSASIAAPAFASGYGPAPFYRPDVGAPSSQRGISAQTLAAEQYNATTVARDDTTSGVGGTVESSQSQSGGAHSRSDSMPTQSGTQGLYFGH
ncbi:hypothetical protein B0G57_102410 [Trinickia symbiotica]|uniref:DUF4148 domain-containing protein n=1 Tax=Trinickia symbiotica TaxID=863227 RepID=A0A2N7XAZ5_9BURK|nr:hypothetical protein [Trinickia symbiotica]PMS38777.1 hypothetical protein C0Z20_02745 [Trinickia symbiotica]PPK46815.1 hypothetical protein B0G57_102410 [Trinickia symbiotica]